MEQAIETAPAVFTKALKRELIPCAATLLHPVTGEMIHVEAKFRLMKDGELTASQARDAVRVAAKRTLADSDILDVLAPVFRTISGVGDFPTEGTPEERFRRYFGGEADDEDLEVEGKILRVLFSAYMQSFFRLIPLELVSMAQALPLHGSGDAEVSEGAPDGAGA